MIGTTPTHTFTLPIDTNILEKVRVIYSQNREVLIKKTEADCKLRGNTVIVKLNQEDTFKISRDFLVEIQLRVKTKDGDVMKSIPERVMPGICLDSEVL